MAPMPRQILTSTNLGNVILSVVAVHSIGVGVPCNALGKPHLWTDYSVNKNAISHYNS